MTAQPLTPFTMLAVDVGTLKCGWAISEFFPAADISKSQWKLGKFGLAERTSETEPAPRAVSIAMEVKEKISSVTGPRLIVIEKPSGTVYGGGKGKYGASGAIGRMSKLQQLFILSGALAMACEMTKDMSYRFLEPSQWQPHHTKRKGMTTKEWSVWRVDHLFKEVYQIKQDVPQLKDHNVCDAINITVASVTKFLSGAWLPPVTFAR